MFLAIRQRSSLHMLTHDLLRIRGNEFGSHGYCSEAVLLLRSRRVETV